jgi:hypothetical protein
MRMSNMLMSQTLGDFLSEFVSLGDINQKQKRQILTMADDANQAHREEVFATEESKAALREYLYAEVSAGYLESEIAEQIASVLSLGVLYPSESYAEMVSAMMLNGPAQAVYNLSGQGNMVRLGKYTGLLGVTSSSVIHNGIWGYATGE